MDSNTPGSITSWEGLLSKFYNKFFPMYKVNEYKKEISSFTQEEDEKFFESWECFKDLLIRCPPHGYEKWRLFQFFYQGLTQPNCNMIESMNGGGGGVLKFDGRFGLQGIGQAGRQLASVGFFELSG